ncbi:hypothetical protein BgiBS90_026471 [Biomphalaria glabrata]|nr:hypothetical protein BgiBS90_026471 [Biomphalaria glabrata]
MNVQSDSVIESSRSNFYPSTFNRPLEHFTHHQLAINSRPLLCPTSTDQVFVIPPTTARSSDLLGISGTNPDRIFRSSSNFPAQLGWDPFECVRPNAGVLDVVIHG